MSESGQTSADVEMDAEVARADLVQTLGQLRENLKPENVMDEVMEQARLTTSELSDRAWKIAREHPIPSVMIGLGAAMILGVGQQVRARAAKRQDWTRGQSFPVDPSMAEPAPQPSSRSASLLQRTDLFPVDPNAGRAPEARMTSTGRPQSGGSVSSAIHAIGDRAAEAKHQLSRKLDSVNAGASRAASRIASSAADLRQQATRVSGPSLLNKSASSKSNPRSNMNQLLRSRDRLTSSIGNLIEDQPLVLAALGIAVGAAIGAAIPTTQTEGQLLGDASGSVKQSARDLAHEQISNLKKTAGETLEQLKQTASDHGLSTDNLSGLVEDVGGTVRNAAYQVGNQTASNVSDRADKLI